MTNSLLQLMKVNKKSILGTYSLLQRSSQFSCASVMKPLYKLGMFLLTKFFPFKHRFEFRLIDMS